jgi:Protein of unknown function DUF262/Protein of unknown function (DUF1524)
MKIEAHECPIGDVLSDRFRFTIPLYQRPYAWTTDEAGEMLEDLLTAALSEASLADTDPYFLGSVVLVKDELSADAEVIDGQQRLTTLTILLSVIRDFLPDQYAASIEGRIFQQGDPIKQTVDQPRLRLRAQDQWFFENHIQRREGLTKIKDIVSDVLPESQYNLIENAKLYRDRFGTLTPAECARLVQFVDQRTYLVIVATQDFESAYRIFSVLNERGLDITIADILKSEIIGTIPSPEQDAYTRRWEAEEDDLGREEFKELFSHIRMVFAKTKAREAILKEFRSSVLSKFPDSRQFIDQVLVPLSDAYEIVTHASYKASSGADEVNRLLQWLNRMDNFDWIPPAISYVRQPGVTASQLQVFLADLERLAASMLVRRVDISRRIERYGLLLQTIESGSDLYAPASPLQLTPEEKSATVDRLSADIYTVTRTRLYVLLRLDSVLSAGGASYDYPIITVEHVLPQNPPAASQWRTWFTEAERQRWTHRLANLVLLPRRKNSEASNYEFDVKKGLYFTTKSGVVPFVLTTQILMEKEWRPALLELRQKTLMQALGSLWRLDN